MRTVLDEAERTGPVGPFMTTHDRTSAHERCSKAAAAECVVQLWLVQIVRQAAQPSDLGPENSAGLFFAQAAR
jgi:hypothetical protein